LVSLDTVDDKNFKNWLESTNMKLTLITDAVEQLHIQIACPDSD
jgi:hypothetical protein